MHLCMKFFDYKNFEILHEAFLTPEEKNENKKLLQYWSIKAKLKSGFLEKAQVSEVEYFSRNDVDVKEVLASSGNSADDMSTMQRLVVRY